MVFAENRFPLFGIMLARAERQMRFESRRNQAVAGISTKRQVIQETAMVATSMTMIAMDPMQPAPKPIAGWPRP